MRKGLWLLSLLGLIGSILISCNGSVTPAGVKGTTKIDYFREKDAKSTIEQYYYS